jgi:nucleoside-diphosphate-sugar epimerase
MKRVIVTGGTGFVGANLARRLLRDGHELHLLVRPGYQPWRIEAIRGDVRLHEVQLREIESVTRVIDQIRPDWVFHLAVYGAFSTQTDLQRMVQTNIHGTINLVQACLKTGFEAFVNTGSSSEYGFKDHPPAETGTLEPNSPYAVSKVAGTLFCRQTAHQQHVHLPTLRLYSIYGPYEDSARLVSTLIVRGLQGELPALVGPESGARLRACRRRGRGLFAGCDASRAGTRRDLQCGRGRANHPSRGCGRRPSSTRDSRRTELGNDARSLVGHERLGGRQSPHLSATGVDAPP